jgi:CheY-like chemotaxis protein
VDRTAPDLARPAARLVNYGASIDGISVLVVDDDRSTREVLAEYLTSCGAVVCTAASAAQALEELQRQRVDVLLADVGMPDEDGYTLIRKVRALNGEIATVPAAALTAFTREEDRRQALHAGYQLHLSKPVDPPELIAAIARLHNASKPTPTGSGTPNRVTRREIAADRIHL